MPASVQLTRVLATLLLGYSFFNGQTLFAEESSTSPDPVASTRVLETLQQILKDSSPTPEQLQPIAATPLSKRDAKQALKLLQDKTIAVARDTRKKEFEDRLLK
ncbi:MAG: hypothetical protein RLY14_2481, partial [Planctomycetota bacterium]